MVVAELVITTESFSRDAVRHVVKYESLQIAKAEFERVGALMKKRADKGNDVPSMLELQGINQLTCKFDTVCAVGFIDYVHANESEKGVKDAYPHLFAR